MSNDYKPGQVLRRPADWKNLLFYQKSDALFQLTFIFCRRFLPPYGDRTVDQMVQAARSGKQNIVEGSEDGKTSTEMELKLLNVARASIEELREDYRDHLNTHGLARWDEGHPRYRLMQEFTRAHNAADDYLAFAERWSEEEYANICLTLCFQVDAMMNNYLKNLEKVFVTEGGIKERMHSARTGYRQGQDERLHQLETECQRWQQAYEELKLRATKAYLQQQKEIETLRQQLKQAQEKER